MSTTKAKKAQIADKLYKLAERIENGEEGRMKHIAIALLEILVDLVYEADEWDL